MKCLECNGYSLYYSSRGENFWNFEMNYKFWTCYINSIKKAFLSLPLFSFEGLFLLTISRGVCSRIWEDPSSLHLNYIEAGGRAATVSNVVIKKVWKTFLPGRIDSRADMPDRNAGETFQEYLPGRPTGQTCRADMSGRHAVKVCRAEMQVWYVGETCRADMLGGHFWLTSGQTCRADMPGRHAGQTYRADIPGIPARQVIFSYSTMNRQVQINFLDPPSKIGKFWGKSTYDSNQ